MPFTPRKFVPFLLTLAASASAQSSADPMPATLLDPIIVTATAIEDDVFAVPYTAQVVGRERFIEQRAVRTVGEAISEVPGVMIQKTGYGQVSPFIRGFTGFRTLLLIDGIRLNNAVFREGPNQYFSTIDAFTLDRIDVVKGPGSVLYGSDAIGGTVNAITRDPQMLPWPETAGAGRIDAKEMRAPVETPSAFSFHPGGFYRYATAENSHSVRGEFSLAATPHLGLFGGVTSRDFDDLRGGGQIGNMPNTAYTEIDGDMKLTFRPNRDGDVTAAFQRVEQNNVPRTHSTIFSRSFDGTTIGSDLRRDLDQLRELLYVQAEARDLAPWLSRAALSLSYHNQEETQDRIRSDGRRSLTGFRDQQFGAFMKLESESPVGTLSYGVEFYHDEVDSHGRQFNADGSLRSIDPRGPVADDSSYDTLGIYLQDRIAVTERFEIIGGVRYSYAHVDAGKVDTNLADDIEFGSFEKSFHGFTGSLRGRFDITSQWNVFGGVSQGFRAPNLSDFTSFELARSGEQEIPAPDLDEEKYVAFELGTKARIEKLRASVYAAYYYTLIRDQISRFPTGETLDGAAVVSKANVGDGYIQGIELGAEWNCWRGFTLFGNLNWQEGEVDTFVNDTLATAPLTRVAPLAGLVGLRWESGDRRWWLEASAQLVRHQDRLSPGDAADTQRIPPGGTGGYSVYAVRANWRPRDLLTVTAAVENMGNEDYRIHGSGQNEPGTNFILQTRLQF